MGEKTVVSSVLNELITLVKHALSLKYSKPSGGIPASDLADGVIPNVPVTGVSVNGTALTPQDGVVDVEVPTDYVNTTDFDERTVWTQILMSYSNGIVAIGKSGVPLSTLIGHVMENCNVWFLLPAAYITGVPSNTDMMRFRMTGANLDTSAPTVSLTSEYGGKVYHAVLSPVSEYRMEGQLQVLDYQTASDVQTAIAGIQTHDPRVAMAATDTTAETQPNTLYVFPEMASLTITLAAPADLSIVNEYHFIFESGATATVTDFPQIPGLDDFAAEANTAYEISILEGHALVVSWEVTA